MADTPNSLFTQIWHAIDGPGEFVEREKVTADGRYEEETRWSTRAVMAVLAERQQPAWERVSARRAWEEVGQARTALAEHEFKLADALGIVGAEEDTDPYEAVAGLHKEIDRLRAELDAATTQQAAPVGDGHIVWCSECGDDFPVNDHYHCPKCKGRTGMMGHPTGCPTKPRVWQKGAREPAGVTCVRDVHGDVWTRRTPDAFGDWWESPETKPMSWEYIAKKWAPLTEFPAVAQ